MKQCYNSEIREVMTDWTRDLTGEKKCLRNSDWETSWKAVT
jgi:hypothetical protein